MNVGGHAVIRMEDLRKLFESFGLENVSTHIQSGNVLFTSPESSASKIEKSLDIKLAKKFGPKAKAFVLTPAQLKKAAAANPLEPEKLESKRRCHVMFLSRKPTPAQFKALKALEGKEYRFELGPGVLYFSYPVSEGGPPRRAVNIERVLDLLGTARTWKVVDQLIEKIEKLK
jgi:uncharacterized protein (DUF1697 family)